MGLCHHTAPEGNSNPIPCLLATLVVSGPLPALLSKGQGECGLSTLAQGAVLLM